MKCSFRWLSIDASFELMRFSLKSVKGYFFFICHSSVLLVELGILEIGADTSFIEYPACQSWRSPVTNTGLTYAIQTWLTLYRPTIHCGELSSLYGQHCCLCPSFTIFEFTAFEISEFHYESLTFTQSQGCHFLFLVFHSSHHVEYICSVRVYL